MRGQRVDGAKTLLQISRQRDLWSVCHCSLLVARFGANHSTSLSSGFPACKTHLTAKLLRIKLDLILVSSTICDGEEILHT